MVPNNDDGNIVNYELPPLVSPSTVFTCYDITEKVKIATNLIGYFQNVLYFDRGCRRLAEPPGGFCVCPTENLLTQIVNALNTCQEARWPQTIDVKTRSLRMVSETLYGLSDASITSDDNNNFLNNLAYLIYPNTFITSEDCQLEVKLSPGAEKYYGLVRGFHSLGRQSMTGFLGKTLSFDAGNWVRLGSKLQWIRTLQHVKIIAGCITITDANKYKKAFSTYNDRIYRDRLLIYLAFVNWCVNNQWQDNLLAFIYSSYTTNGPRRGCALTLEVAPKSCAGEPWSDFFRGTVLRFLHAEDGYCDSNPSQCPPTSVSMIEGGLGLLNQELNSLCANVPECQESETSLMVPLAYWNLITELQTHCFPGGIQNCYTNCKPDYCYENNGNSAPERRNFLGGRSMFNDASTESTLIARNGVRRVSANINNNNGNINNNVNNNNNNGNVNNNSNNNNNGNGDNTNEVDVTQNLLNSLMRRQIRRADDEMSEHSVSVQTTIDETTSIPSTIVFPRRR